MCRKRIVVVGGGISGLSAAYETQKQLPDAEVKILEAGSRLGGVIQTIHKDGFLIEGAADNFITTTPSAVELCQQLGLSDELIRTNPNGHGAMVLSHGKLRPIPPGFMVMAPSRIWPILATRILSPIGKLRSGCEIFVPRRCQDKDESLQSFVTRRFGKEMFERLVQPLVGGIYTADPARLSVLATMPRFLEMEQKHGSLIRAMFAGRRQNKANQNRGGARYSQFVTLRGGMSRLIDALGDALPPEAIQFDSPVYEVRRDPQHWTVRYGENDASIRADAVVVAAPSKHAAAMLRNVDRKIARRLAQIDYASCAIVTLAFRREQIQHPIDSFGFVVPHIENHFILSCSFSSEKYEGRAPNGTVLMRVFIGGAMQAGLLRMGDHQLEEIAFLEVSKLLRVNGKPILRHTTRQNHAMPQYHLGHKQRIAEINERLTQSPTLAIAGGCLNGVGVPGCIESGRRAADKVVQELRLQTGELTQEPALAN